MPDPVSWLVIEPGWKVVGSGGEPLGQVAEVVGDQNADIFGGLVVSPGLLRRKVYVPAEAVTAIVEGSIELDLTPAVFERLEQYEEPPPQVDVRHDTTDIRPQ